MGALVQPGLVSQLLRIVPPPVRRALDGWSERVARRRWEQRQQRWRAREAAAQAAKS